MVKYLRLLAALAMVLASGAMACADDALVQYPLQKPVKQEWSFSGPFGTYDKAQLQRGLQVYVEVCSLCHGMKFVSFRDLQMLGYEEEDIGAIAARFQITDGPDQEGEMFTRPAAMNDYFPNPFANDEQAAFANNGAVPVDLSLISRGRGVSAPFPGFLTDMFTMYNEAGPDYIYNLLVGFQDPPENVEVAEGNWYNPYFMSGDSLAMAPPLFDESITYQDGTEPTLENFARDVSAFLAWTADPHMEMRKKTGFKVIIFLILLAGLLYMLKRSVWTKIDQES